MTNDTVHTTRPVLDISKLTQRTSAKRCYVITRILARFATGVIYIPSIFVGVLLKWPSPSLTRIFFLAYTLEILEREIRI